MKQEEIYEYVKKQYGTIPEYLWKSSPESAILRHKNGKWYAAILRVEKSKLGLKEEGTVDIINVKCEPDMVGLLTQTYGFLTGYHMNKKYWITILLDGSVSEAKILEYWIRIGRLETKKAEEIALSLSDDKLLIYAYMKEADDLENNTKIDGSKKKQRLDELESQIEKLGDKYEPKEEETVEKIDGAVQENTSTQEPQTQEPTDTAQ